MMERVVERELLDVLSPEDARAQRSRADLRRLNSLMAHVGIMTRLWGMLGVPPTRCSLVELGAGDGIFCLRLARRLLPRWQLKEVTLIDKHQLVSAETRTAFENLGCATEVICQDVFDWVRSAPQATVMVANLFLHHFSEADLQRLFALASERTDYFIACEPQRGALSLAGSGLLGLIGCNAVTRHDAVASVRAGFAGSELSALWPAQGWVVAEKAAGLFSHSLAARRVRRI